MATESSIIKLHEMFPSEESAETWFAKLLLHSWNLLRCLTFI